MSEKSNIFTDWRKVAEEQGVFATTGWAKEDVLGEAEFQTIEITEAEAIELLSKYDEDIVSAMVRAGWQVIEDAIYSLYGKR